MKNWKKTMLLVLGVLLLIILFQNIDPVNFRLLFWKVPVSPVVLFLTMLLTGFAAGRLARRKRG